MSAPIEFIPGSLSQAVAQAEPGSILHWDEMSAAQIADPQLRRGLYAADYPQYSLEGKEPTLWLARHTAEQPNNLVLVHLFDEKNSSYEQLLSSTTGHFFRPDQDEARAVMQAKDTLRVPLGELRLQGDDASCRFLAIRTADGQLRVGKKYQEPNEAERQLLERAGYTPEFLAVLRSPAHRITETAVYVLAPEYAAHAAAEGPVGRAAWRNYFNSYADANALDLSVGNRFGLLGVPDAFYQEAKRTLAKGRDKEGKTAADLLREIRKARLENAASQTSAPEKVPVLEDILAFSREYVKPKCWADYEAGIRQRLK